MPSSPPATGYCTGWTYSWDSSGWGASGSSCGDNTFYVSIAGHAEFSFPAGQHSLRLTCPGFTPPNRLQVDTYSLVGSSLYDPEQCDFWNAGTSLNIVRNFSSAAERFAIAFRSGDVPGTPPLIGLSFRFDLKNTSLEAPCGPPPPPCQYGTELTIPGQAMYYLSPLVIDAICVSFGAPWAAVFFTAFWFTAIDATELCGDLPPAPPAVSLETMSWAPDKLLELLHSMAWWYFCKCTSGPTTPVTPPKPPLTQPPGLPVAPTVTCDPANICASLIAIQKQLAALAQTVGQDYNVDTLVQRYSLPFGYVTGAVHSTLPSSGSFAISRLIGMRAELVSAPPSYVLEGTPRYLWNLGWMSLSDGGAMLQEKRVTRDSMDWLPPDAQLATTFGWYMKPGATLRFTELEPEP